MNAEPAELLDTNVLIYAFSLDRRNAVAEQLLARGCLVSLQGLNEFANVARRKLSMTWDEIAEATAVIRELCPPVLPMTMEAHEDAIAIAGRYGLGFFDSLMIATALTAGCRVLWSEDMQNGMMIDDRLRISNPFVGA